MSLDFSLRRRTLNFPKSGSCDFLGKLCITLASALRAGVGPLGLQPNTASLCWGPAGLERGPGRRGGRSVAKLPFCFGLFSVPGQFPTACVTVALGSVQRPNFTIRGEFNSLKGMLLFHVKVRNDRNNPASKAPRGGSSARLGQNQAPALAPEEVENKSHPCRRAQAQLSPQQEGPAQNPPDPGRLNLFRPRQRPRLSVQRTLKRQKPAPLHQGARLSLEGPAEVGRSPLGGGRLQELLAEH
ncbi:hypothetical protein Cadr_000018644 [Camelus dromedarius]|uniref:Uncharacterized protein n=1 Tax=Camelus dromedarius TaxID=9838 RepID=A0A5N4D412_CAMDR|nr:hypothetical protein Cadr_000018644 [Camelus dromedarius]